MTSPLTSAEIRRYGRHLVIPEVGREGQERLKAARVLVVGAGGLGSPAALYLAAAGIGTLGLVDFDRVDESNLQRQILYGQEDVGRPKLETAVERLGEINPLISLVRHDDRLTSDNALDIVADYDIVVDGSDNFPTRYLVNDACVLAGKPDVYGAIHRFEGQVAVFWGAEGPCYRCLFPEPPPPGLVPSCAEAGVLGVLPGIIGSLQANEAIKLALGVGESLVGRLLVFDALGVEMRQLGLDKSDDCPVCGPRPTLTELIDYERFCGLGDSRGRDSEAAEPGGEETEMEVEFDISAEELDEWRRSGREHRLVDVRTDQEIAIAKIEGAEHIPLAELPQRLDELDPEADLVVHCHHGPRSIQAVSFLRRKGFSRARNLAGGIDAWSAEIDPTVPQY